MLTKRSFAKIKADIFLARQNAARGLDSAIIARDYLQATLAILAQLDDKFKKGKRYE